MKNTRIFSLPRLISMREQMAFMEELTEGELGFDIMSETLDDDDDDEEDEDDARDVSRVIEDIREVVRRPPGKEKHEEFLFFHQVQY